MYFKSLLFLLLSLHTIAYSQVRGRPVEIEGGGGGIPGRLGGLANRGSGGGKTDSLKKRSKSDDSIAVSYRFINDFKRYNLDSTIHDFSRFPTQPNYITLGNNGSASKPILYTPITKAGFDEGRHHVDAYKWTINTVKFYKANKPHTELDYVIGSKAEQTIQFTHTQNRTPDWNFAFDYRLISAPGYIRSQKNNISNLVVNSHYQSKRKRYNNWLIILQNSIKNNDFGGVKNDSQLVDPNRDDRSLIETRLNNDIRSARNPFNSKLESGNWERERTYYLKHSYDLGKKDSIAINDSTTNYLFYPKLRFEHTIHYTTQFSNYLGQILYSTPSGQLSDSSYYLKNYGSDTLFTKNGSTFELKDEWQQFYNDFSIYQFPDTKNTQQYIKAGISYESWKGKFTEGIFRASNRNFSNLMVHGEYKNRTRNRKWDLSASGLLYLSGYNSGDYEANAILVRDLSARLGNIKLQFQNINRTPSFVFYNQSSFNINTLSSIKKENHTILTASLFNDKKQQNITAQFITSANLTTWQNFTIYRQEDVFNMLRISFERKFKLYRKLVLRTEAHFQQAIIGKPQFNYATLYTRNRIGYEGNLGKKNLRLATGVEVRYILPYKLDAWSPLTGQFVYQDSISSKTNLPDINLYLNLNISRFAAFVRIENLNTAKFRTGTNAGLKFVNNNYAAQLYPNPGMVFRLGIYWRFIN
jgi:hypothetical protein